MGRDFRTNMTPRPSSYRAETILVLDRDPELARVAAARAKKRSLAGQQGSINLILFGTPISIPNDFRGEDTRITIIAHGVPNSSVIGAFITPQVLAKQLETLADGGKFGRVALHACYAGGNRTSATQFAVVPKSSFGFKLAQRCGFVGSITAKTLRNIEEFIDDNENQPTGQIHTFVLEEGGDIQNRREMTRGDKVVFWPKPLASPQNPVDPGVVLPPV